MNNVKINNELNLAYPDDFREMGEEELSKYFGSAENRWGVYDADKHIILSVSWSKPGFFRSLTDAESVVIGTEMRLRRGLLNYQRISTFKMKLQKKKKAEGLRFEYRVNDKKLVQVADLIIFKHKKKFYSIYYITRKSNAAEVRPAFKDVLDSIQLDK